MPPHHSRRIENIVARAILATLLALASYLLLAPAPIASLVLISLAGAIIARPLPQRSRWSETPPLKAAKRALAAASQSGHPACAMSAQIDGYAALSSDLGLPARNSLLSRLAGRLNADLPYETLSPDLQSGRVDIIMSPKRRMDTQSALQLASRLQNRLSEPVQLGSASHVVTVSIGFCLSSRLTDPTAQNLLDGARRALTAAQQKAPNSICGDSELLRQRTEASSRLAEEIPQAILNRQICAYFQPQISARTGAITGFEALARWQHPARGLIPPSEFLPVAERTGQMNRLGMRIAEDALDALREWRAKGFDVPLVGVNFSQPELARPDLVSDVTNALEARGLEAESLAIEVLETVVAANPDNAVSANLAALAQLGCRVDLDDFGTGHASITSIRQFSVERIKIDRSFVTGVDNDPEQRSMVSAILLMADRLGLETLAEGVETRDEHKTLTQLGCGHLQGFGIGRPMKREDTIAWMTNYLGQRPQTSQRTRRPA